MKKRTYGPQEILSNECIIENRAEERLGWWELVCFHPPLSVRLIKDIISPHKPSRAQEILERAVLWVKGWYPQCSQLWVCISNQITDRFLSPYFQVVHAKSPALPYAAWDLVLQHCLTASPPRYRLSPQAATRPSTPKPWAARENQSKRRHRQSWGFPTHRRPRVIIHINL